MMDGDLLLELKDAGLFRHGKTELERFNLRLAPGESLVVLGEAGSGKDAVLRLVGGFTDKTDSVSGTIRYGAGREHPLGREKPAIRTAYLTNPLRQPLAPHASVAGQLIRIVARKLHAPFGSAREELRLALENLPGGVTLALLDAKPERLDPLSLATGLLAAVTAQTPDLVLADAPFADLGPGTIKHLLEGLVAEHKRLGFGLIYATGGLQPAARLGGRVLVLKAGRVVEEGPFERLISGNAHAYTKKLFGALPTLNREPPKPRGAPRGQPLLQVHNIPFASEKSPRDVLTFELRRSGSLALVGEPGSGRRTLLRQMLGFDSVKSGRVVFDAVDLNILSQAMANRMRRRIAFISGKDDTLDPRMSLWDTVDEPLRAHLDITNTLIAECRDAALTRVGLASHDGRTPVHALSAFDKRRLQIARAYVAAPLLVVIDEPLRALDAFAQSILREVLIDFRATQETAFLVLTSDLTIAQSLAEDALVFDAGKMVERASIAHLVYAPQANATKSLIEAVSLGLSPAARSV